MYIVQVHLLIEQGLQNIGVFAYGDVLHSEIDLQINKKLLALIEEEFLPIKESKFPYELTQGILDRFQNLQVKDLILTPSRNTNSTLNYDFYSIALPANYLHLVADVSNVLLECNDNSILTGNIKTGVYYMNKGDKSITYNTIVYNKGDIFLGVIGVTGYTYSGNGILWIVKLKSKRSPNRLTEEELLPQVLQNALQTTEYRSPLSSLSGNNYYVYVDDFYISNIFLTYVRQPKLTNFDFTIYTSSDTLVIGTQYESVNGQVVYNGITYNPFQPFTIITGHLSITSGVVRVYQDGDLELNDTMSYRLIDATIAELSILLEQTQQKIVNLKQEDV